MASDTINLSAYAQRIGYTGPLAPTWAVLNEITRLHTTAIPFENLSILLGQTIGLELDALQHKLISSKRGGYCFEQNRLLMAVLQQIGFEVTPLSGRVRVGTARDVTPPRTHLFLRVEVAGQSWLTDVGVGGFSLTAPLRWALDVAQDTPHETRRIVFEENRFFHQVWLGGTWSDVYEFTGEAMGDIDREIANWWTSTSPNSKFCRNLMVSRADKGRIRRSILNNRYTLRRGPDVLEEVSIETPEQLLKILAREFDLTFAVGTQFSHGKCTWPSEGKAELAPEAPRTGPEMVVLAGNRRP